MTVLQRTDLTTSQKIQCAAAAVAGQHAHGSKTALSEAYEISRPTVYAVGAAAQSVLRSHFESPLLQGAAVDVRVDDAQLRRAVVALRVLAPNAIRPIEDLVPLLYPGVKVSYGTIQQMLVEAEGRAARFNAQVSLGGVEAGALDEMFSQGEPVLAGVDLDSGYLFGLSLSATRDGEAWAGLLREGQAQGLGLSVVVKDAAKGIAAGVSEVFPRAEQRDDCFHVLYEMHKVRRRLERRAYATIEREGEALGRLGKIRAYDKERRRKAKRELSSARRGCAEAIGRFDAFEAALDTLRGALECVDIHTGELHRPEHVEALIEQVARRIESLGVGKCTKLAKYLRNRAPGLALAQKSVLPRLEALAEPWSAQAVSLACICWYLVRALHKRPARARYRALYRHLLAAYGALQDQLGAASASLLEAVEAVLHQRHRASSAIEGFNAALRPYLYVHKGATQGFLALFRAWFNLRTRRWGRHKGTSAHECLTRTAGPRLAHAARLSALADTALIHGRCRALASLDTPDPEHCVPRDRPARVCKDELPHFDRSRLDTVDPASLAPPYRALFEGLRDQVAALAERNRQLERREPEVVVEGLRSRVVASLTEHNWRLEHLLRELRRAMYGKEVRKAPPRPAPARLRGARRRTRRGRGTGGPGVGAACEAP